MLMNLRHTALALEREAPCIIPTVIWYFVLRKTGYLKVVWPEIEYVLRLYGPQVFFNSDSWPNQWRDFAERATEVLDENGASKVLKPSAFLEVVRDHGTTHSKEDLQKLQQHLACTLESRS
jgi:predicted SAM-dependent methyltransferase